MRFHHCHSENVDCNSRALIKFLACGTMADEVCRASFRGRSCVHCQPGAQPGGYNIVDAQRGIGMLRLDNALDRLVKERHRPSSGKREYWSAAKRYLLGAIGVGQCRQRSHATVDDNSWTGIQAPPCPNSLASTSGQMHHWPIKGERAFIQIVTATAPASGTPKARSPR
jgi:hypothetical protein